MQKSNLLDNSNVIHEIIKIMIINYVNIYILPILSDLTDLKIVGQK